MNIPTLNTLTNTPSKTAVTAALAAAVLTLTACGTTSSPTPAAGTTTTSVATSASSASSSMMPSAAASMPMPMAAAGPHNQADVTFAQQMTIHHQGAIAMADLAPSRAASSQIKTLAAAIKAAQAPEIIEMKMWLARWVPGAGMSGMAKATAMGGMTATTAMGGMASTGSSSSMPGMMTDQQMTALTAASGAAFDKMFLQLMITHHQGALTMATTEKAQGSNPAALKLADSITASQTAQIAQMQTMLKGL